MGSSSVQFAYALAGGIYVENNYNNANGAYVQSISYDDTDGGKSTTFSWSGTAYTNGPISGFPEMWVGKKPSWGSSFTNPAVTAAVKNISDFRIKHTITPANGAQYFDIAFDLWLTKTVAGDMSTVKTEVMIWLDCALRPPTFGNYAGKYAYGDKTAKVYTETISRNGNTWNYVAVIFDTAQLVGETNIKDVFDHLVRNGLINGDHYINGWEFGCELSGGSGAVTFSNVTYTFQKGTAFPDKYAGVDNTINGPALNFAAIMPSDATDLSNATRGIFVGVGGDVVAVTKDGTAVTFKSAMTGSTLPVRARRINSTGTTATNLVALW